MHNHDNHKAPISRNLASQVLCGLLLMLALSPAAIFAAGESTHAFMAERGREALPDSPLRTLLTRHRASVLAGAMYPDGGYWSGAIFPDDREVAERAHWGDFVDHFITYLRDKGCAREVQAALPANAAGVFNPNGVSDACGRLVAFAFGIAAHGLTDETWDDLFVPMVEAHGEDTSMAGFLDHKGTFGQTTPAALARQVFGEDNYRQFADLLGVTPMNGIDYAMDMLAITEYHLWTETPVLEFPPSADLVEVYKRNRPDQGVTAEMIERGTLMSHAIILLERLAPLDVTRIRRQMPWAAANYYTAAGGVMDSAYMVAGHYQQLWQKLLQGVGSAAIAPWVVGTHPRHGAVGVPVKRDAAEGRIFVFIGHSLDRPSVERDGAISLFDEQGNVVAGKSSQRGYRGDGTHGLDFLPDADLKPQHRYTVILTTKIRDAQGRTLPRVHSWSFTTAGP